MTVLFQELTSDEKERLFQLALEARENSYSPYSKFRVGACLLTEKGEYFKGCNIENASYGATICAERTAIVKAVSEGHNKLRAIAISSDQPGFVSPCGICRQVISEFSQKETPVYFLNKKGEHKEISTEKLLPFAFSSDDM